MKVSWILSIVGMHRNMGFTVYCLGPVSLWHTNRKPWFLAPTPRLCIWLCIKDVQCACLVRLTHQPDDGARGLKRVKNTSRSLHHHRCTDSRSTSVATQKKKKTPTRDHHQHYQSSAATIVPSWTSAICDSGQRTVGDLKCMSEHIEADTCYCAEIAQPRHMAALRSAAIGTSPGQQQVTPHAFLQSWEFLHVAPKSCSPYLPSAPTLLFSTHFKALLVSQNSEEKEKKRKERKHHVKIIFAHICKRNNTL